MEGSGFLDRYKPIMSSAVSAVSNLASDYHERIERQIEDLYKELEKDEQMLVIIPLKNGKSIIAEWFGYHNPHMIIIEGIQPEDGSTVRLLIHQADLQIVMQRVKPEAGKPPTRKIGFQRRENKGEQDTQ